MYKIAIHIIKIIAIILRIVPPIIIGHNITANSNIKINSALTSFSSYPNVFLLINTHNICYIYNLVIINLYSNRFHLIHKLIN